MSDARFCGKRRRLLAALVLAPSVGPVWAADAERQAWSRRPAKPRIDLPTLDGTVWSLAAQSGRPVLLNFWASWCAPCRNEMPSLEILSQRYEDSGLQVIAVNFREADATVRRFVDATGLRLPVLRDADGAVARSLGVHTFPTTVAIDRQGRARFSVVGECDWGGRVADGWVAELVSGR